MAKKIRKVLVAKWDKVIIKPLPEEERTINGFVVPDMGKETPAFGTIVKVGPGVMNVYGHFIPNTSKVDDVVAIPRIGSFNFMYNGEEYYITREQEILAGEEDEEYDDEI